jgi:hypothetical protein
MISELDKTLLSFIIGYGIGLLTAVLIDIKLISNKINGGGIKWNKKWKK